MQLKNFLKSFPPTAGLNSLLKGSRMEFQAEQIRCRYLREAKRLRVEQRATGTPFRDALVLRLGDRPKRRGWPKPKGDLHIFLAYSHVNWEDVLPSALSPFGRVSVFEFHEQGFDERRSDWIAQREKMNLALTSAFERASEISPVDVVVCYGSGYTILPKTLLAMAERGAIITNFCFDDKVRWPGRKFDRLPVSTAAIAAAVDLNLTNDPAGQYKYLCMGGLAMFHPEAAHPDLHRPMSLPFKYDVSFIGACYGWRPAFISALARRGLTIECFGNGWPNGPVSAQTMQEIYSQSRVNLGFSAIDYCKTLMCLKGRDFEVPMSGGLYLTQHNPELSLVYSIGKDIVTYSNVDDCYGTITRMLNNNNIADEIRRSGRARALKDHTYEARWTHVLRTLGAL